MDEPQDQGENRLDPRIEAIRPFQYKKGQSGNPGGRPVGSKSLKTYAKEMLERMTDEEREDYLHGMNKDFIWEMGEGKATNKIEGDINLKVEKLEAIQEATKTILGGTN